MCVKEIHLGRADEARHEQVGRVVEHFLRRADLLDEAVLHDDDAVAQGHGLGLVVGDVDEGGVDALAQLDDLRAHLVAQLGVQVGQRLVHQEHLGITDDGAADGHALALAAGQRLGLAVQVLGDVQNLGRLPHLLVDLLLGYLAQLQGEGHVLIYGHVGVQGVALEDHGDVPVLRLHVVHPLAADDQIALGDILQAGDHPQRGGLAAAGGADQDDELLVRNLQVEVVNRGHLVVIDLLHILQGYSCHVQGRKGNASANTLLPAESVTLRTLRQVSTLPHRRPGGRSSFLTAPPPYENGVGSEGLNFGAHVYRLTSSPRKKTSLTSRF